MKGFFGAFLVFLLWTFACIYYISTKGLAPSLTESEIFIAPDNSSETNAQITETTYSQKTTLLSEDFLLTPDGKENYSLIDSLDRSGIEREASLLLAEEIQKSLAIIDTIDIEKYESKLKFEKDVSTPTVLSFSNRNFYPRYNGTDLILDQELVTYATELKQLLKERPEKKITIVGHTDYVGSTLDNFNQGLKMSRQIKWYLTDRRGIPRRKITATSRGELEPITSNKTFTGRRKNNRIQIIVN